MKSKDLLEKRCQTLNCHMPKLAVLLNFSTSNLASITLNLEDIKDFEDSLEINYGADKLEAEYPDMVVRKCYTFINLQ